LPDDLPIVTRTADREIILFPRRANQGFLFLLAFPFALPFLGVAVFFTVAFFFPRVLNSRPTFTGPFLARPSGYLVAALFCGGFYLIGGGLLVGTLFHRFGRNEIHLWPGHIRTYSRLGFLRLWRTHRLDTLARIAVRSKDGASTPSAGHDMALDAFVANSVAVRLATGYRQEQLLAAARHLRETLPKLGAPGPIQMGAPPLRDLKARARRAMLAHLELQRPAGGGVRITVPGYPWWGALLLTLAAGPAAAYVMILLAMNLVPHARGGPADVSITAVTLAVVVVAAYWLNCDLIAEANSKRLTLTTRGLLGVRTRTWPAAEVARLEVVVRTRRNARGGYGLKSCWLEIIPERGGRRRYGGSQSEETLRWIRGQLSDALWPPAQGMRANVVPPPTPVAPGPTSLPAPRVDAPAYPGSKLFGLSFSAFSLIFLVAGGYAAIVQDHRLRHGVATPAVVTDVRSVSHVHRGQRGNDWVIHYQYFAGGQTYESTDLFPGAMLGPVETRLHDGLVSSIPDGSQTTAWYVDDDPSRAYLVRERLFTCYDVIFFADVFFCAGLLVARRRGEDDTPKTRRGRRRTLALAWTGIGGLALAHYLLPWPAHWPVDFLVVAPLWAITSLVAIVVWTRSPSRTAGAGDGRVGP
jgi:hypothetical protein